jgi:NADH:ubiquinone oxidoreductase subunit
MQTTEAEILREAQDFITREVQKKGADRINALTWEQTPQDRATKIHRLVIFRGEEKSVFTFTEYELLEHYGSKEWEKHLQSHISDIMMEF